MHTFFARPARGASLTDYGLVVALIAIVVIGALSALSGSVADPFAAMNSALNGTGGTPSGGGEPSIEPTPTPTPEPEPFALDGSFDVDNTDSAGNAWGTWGADFGNGGTGDGGVALGGGGWDAAMGPQVAVTGGHTYALRLTGCANGSGGGTGWELIWFDEADAQLSVTPTVANDHNCPDWRSKELIAAAPLNATYFRLRIDWNVRFDDLSLEDLSELTVSSDNYMIDETFETGAVGLDGRTWPGTWSATGSGGSGPGYMNAYQELGPAYAVTAGNTYKLSATGCTTSGGASQMHVRWYDAAGTQLSVSGTSDWSSCPTWSFRQSWHTAPANATLMRIWFAYNNHYDDLRVEDLDDATAPPVATEVMVASFDSGPVDDHLGYTWTVNSWNGSNGPSGNPDDGAITTTSFGASPIYPVQAGRTISYSVWACSDSGGGTSFNLQWFSNSAPGASVMSSGGLANCPTWANFNGTAVVPAGVNGIRLNGGYLPRIGDVDIRYTD